MQGGTTYGAMYSSPICSPTPTEFLDFTSVTLDEFQQLVPGLRGRVSSAYGGVVPRWEALDCPVRSKNWVCPRFYT